MQHKFSRLISAVFHPLLITTYGFVAIFNSSIETIPSDKAIGVTAIILLFTFLFPSAIALAMLKMGKIESLQMHNPQERIVPYAMAALSNFSLFYLFYSIGFNELITSIIFASSIAILLVFIINFYWKISAHSVGIGGLTGAIAAIQYNSQANLYPLLIGACVLAFAIAYSRLKLKAHTKAQVYAGLLIGFFVEFWIVILY